MKITSDKEFETHAAELLHGQEAVCVTSNGKATGIYIPLEEAATLPIELRRQLSARLAEDTAAQLAAQGVTEEDVLADFEEFRKNRS